MDQPQNVLVPIVLGDVELRNHLPLPPRARISLNRDVKAAFSIHEPRHVVAEPFVWPSLLIARTGRIVTAHTLIVRGSTAESSGFPAYSRIYRQQRSTYCLTTF